MKDNTKKNQHLKKTFNVLPMQDDIIKKSTIDTLERQKQILRKSLLVYIEFIIVFVLFFVFLVVLPLVKNVTKIESLYYIFLFVIFSILCAFVFGFFKIYLIFRKIKNLNVFKEEIVAINCEKPKFIFVPIHRDRFSLICVIFISESNDKYYYLSNNLYSYDKKRLIAELTCSKVLLTCYRGTNFIKEYKTN